MLRSCRSTAKQAETVFVTCDLIETSESDAEVAHNSMWNDVSANTK